MESSEYVWHREVIDQQVERALNDLHKLGILDRHYLAGGTGLALHLGHRRSRDLDFFTRDPLEPEVLIGKMKSLDGFTLASQSPGTLHATVQGIKVSLLAYPYRVLFPLTTFLGVNVADPRDIACMKVSAIAGRGTKRDFIDLYILGKQYGLAQVLDWFKQKYADVNQNVVHVLKSLTYFEDADKDPIPGMLTAVPWEEAKKFFRKESSRLSP